MIPLLAFSACATGYDREGFFTNGYSDYRLSERSFVVTFRANEFTSEEKAMKYALKRAAEVTLENGFSYFAISDKLGGKKPAYPSVRVVIDCYLEKPDTLDAIHALDFLSKNG